MVNPLGSWWRSNSDWQKERDNDNDERDKKRRMLLKEFIVGNWVLGIGNRFGGQDLFPFIVVGERG